MAFVHGALDVLFPPRCAGCSRAGWPFCPSCAVALTPLEPPWCLRCGRPLAASAPRCAGCPPSTISTARAPFLFEGPARRAILRLKFSGWRRVGDALAAAMITVHTGTNVDAVTWVPLASRRLAERGYDQAQILAVAIARELDLPAVSLLRRTSSTGPQARRSAAQRRSAMRGVFASRGPSPARILLVDDVLTTGATAAECAAVLRASGVREVHLLSAARSIPGLRRPSYTRWGPRPGLWLPGDHPRKSTPAAGETTHVRRLLVAEHGAV